MALTLPDLSQQSKGSHLRPVLTRLARRLTGAHAREEDTAAWLSHFQGDSWSRTSQDKRRVESIRGKNPRMETHKLKISAGKTPGKKPREQPKGRSRGKTPLAETAPATCTRGTPQPDRHHHHHRHHRHHTRHFLFFHPHHCPTQQSHHSPEKAAKMAVLPPHQKPPEVPEAA